MRSQPKGLSRELLCWVDEAIALMRSLRSLGKFAVAGREDVHVHLGMYLISYGLVR